VRVPAGKLFYLYVTQTLDQDDARIGGSRVETVQPAAAAAANPTALVKYPPASMGFRSTPPSLRAPASSASQIHLNP
jgi:hypothetical protein